LTGQDSVIQAARKIKLIEARKRREEIFQKKDSQVNWVAA